MKIKKFALGRGITNLSVVITKRSRKPNPVMTKEERLYKTRELIKQLGKVPRYGIQKKFRWGDGIMERLHRDLVTLFDNEISWNPKQQTYYWIANIKQETLV